MPAYDGAMTMTVGAAQVDISPPVGVELTGYIGREQPSTGLLDPLYGRCLIIGDHAGRSLAWINLDLLAVPNGMVAEVRNRLGRRLGLTDEQVMVTCTHTHCGPACVRLNRCGQIDPAYVNSLPGKLEELAVRAAQRSRPGRLVTACGQLDLARDRRGKPTACTDPLVGTVGWRDAGGQWLAAAIVYSMHPVSLGASRMISADWPGAAAAQAAIDLPGEPVVLVSSGACGNLNPPERPVSPEQMVLYGQQVARAACETLAEAAPATDASLWYRSHLVEVPLETMTPQQIDALVARMRSPGGDRPTDQAAELWRRSMAGPDAPSRAMVELHAVRIGPLSLIGVNAETFCSFTHRLRQRIEPNVSPQSVHVLGCCNGQVGYLPHSEAYDEGGYEVDSAFVFYNAYRPVRGSLENLADQAAELLVQGGRRSAALSSPQI